MSSDPQAREEQVRLKLSDGVELASRLFPPAGTPRGTLIYLHGMQSHSGWFTSTAGQLADAGFLALFADRRGSGLNPRDQANRSNISVLIRDVAEISEHARRLADERGLPGDLPSGLIGHSFGGLLSVLAMCKKVVPVDWLCLISPMIAVKAFAKQLRSWKEVSFVLKLYFSRRREIVIPYSYEALTNWAEGRKFMESDPLMLRKMEARFFKAYLSATNALLAQLPARSITCPVLLSLAGQDQLVDNQKTEKLVRRLCAGDFQVHTHKDCGHTIELSPSRSDQVSSLLGFLAGLSPKEVSS